MPIIPATLSFAADGTPYSETFDDVYHSSDGGLGQAQHVFLAGNDLPQRWRGKRQFVVVETGFGLGLNFLATWAAWRDDAQHCERLHFVSCELHPFHCEDLARLHTRWPEFAGLAAELQAAWPTLLPGVHRLNLDRGRVCLTLYFGDANDGLRQLTAQADAFMLDGFSPSKNQSLWSPRIYYQISRMAAPDATLATWSVAGEVREGLRRAGFHVEKTPGFGAKREMLRGHIDHGMHPARKRPDHVEPAGRALVVGAGVAGTSIANRLAERGWLIELIEAGNAPAQGASGNIAGVLRALPSLDEAPLTRLTRAGALYALRHLGRLEQQGAVIKWGACGALHLAANAEQEARQRQVVDAGGLPETFLRYVSRDEAAAIAHYPVRHGGWWLPQSAWVQPPSLCAANLLAWPQHIRCHFGRALHSLTRNGDDWCAMDASGRVIAHAPVAILANGTGIMEVAQAAALPVRSARGQVSHLPAVPGSPPDVLVCCSGYVTPPVDGLRCAGATFSLDDNDSFLREADQLDNLEKLDFMLPGFNATLPAMPLAGRVGFRPVSPDRLPIVGAVPCWPAELVSRQRGQGSEVFAHQPGLYAVSGFGARGLVWASLVAEQLASQLNNEPQPLEQKLAAAIDPMRYLQRGYCQGQGIDPDPA